MGSVDEREFKRRTKAVALRVIRLVGSLPRNRESDVIGRQILRSDTSIGANYRAACRGVSRADMISKLSDVEEETDETLYWMELLVEGRLVSEARLRNLMSEVEEILAMTTKSIKTLRSRRLQSKI